MTARTASGTGTGGKTTGNGSRVPATPASRLAQSTCVFWLGQRCLGIDVATVGEVVTVDRFAKVPSSRPEVHGLFNLRGSPVVLVDLAQVLGLDGAGAEARSAPSDKRTLTALVLRAARLEAGLVIDKMEAVVPAGRGEFSLQDAGDDAGVIHGFLEVSELASRVVTVLRPSVMFERLSRLRYARAEE